MMLLDGWAIADQQKGLQIWSTAIWRTCWLLFVMVTTVGAVTSDHPLLLILSFDGFRYDYLDNETFRTPNLDSLIADGVRAPWIQPRYITKTFPNHFSIATGLYEESHGIVANSFFDPVLNETFEMGDVDAKWWDVGGLPLWVLNQMSASDRYSGGMMWPGTNARIRNQTAHHVAGFDATVSWRERVDIVLKWFQHCCEPANLVYMYFQEPDHTEHSCGTHDRRVVDAVESVDHHVGYLIERLRDAELYDRVNVIITSDHGMADVPEENKFFMTDFVNVSLFRAFGSSPVWSVLPNPGLENEVYNTFLNASTWYHFTVYLKDDIPDTYHYKNNQRVMPILVTMDEHYDLYLDRGSVFPNGTTGNHGYNNSLMSMQAVFVARGPQFKRGYVSEPFENIDIFLLGCRLLGLEPPPNNATPDAIMKLLQHPGVVVNLDGVLFVVLSVMLTISILTVLYTVIRLRVQTNRKSRENGSSAVRSDGHVDTEENQRLLLPS